MMPHYAQDFTDEQREELVDMMTKWPLAKLRKHQNIHDQQITLAHQQGKLKIMESEQVKWQIVTSAIFRKELA